MSNSAIIKSTGQQVSIVSVNGGWTTVVDEMGSEFKVRNGALAPQVSAEDEKIAVEHRNVVAQTVKEKAIEAYFNDAHEEDFEVEKEECDDPDHNDVKEDFIDDKPTENRIRRVKDATYNPENMRKLTSSNGNLSYDCGDSLARRLEGKTLEEVYTIASDELGVSQPSLKKKYEHLNAGMQRMNLGNRIRAAASKAARGHIESLEAKNK